MGNQTNKAKLDLLFQSMDKAIKGRLPAGDAIAHPHNKGVRTEYLWLQMLESYLPMRYKIDSGFVVDSENSISDQIDIIIYDRTYTPFIFVEQFVKYIPAEGVYAIFEVKQKFDDNNYKYAINKVESVKRLKRTSASFQDYKGQQKKSHDFGIIGGIITTKIGSKTKFSNAKDLDIIFSFDYALKIRKSSGGYDTFEQCKVPICAVFVLKLTEKLRDIGTVAALEIDNYLKWAKHPTNTYKSD
jgi:hypothetical protein